MSLLDILKQTTLLDWVLSIILLFSAVCVIVYLFTAKKEHTFLEEGFETTEQSLNLEVEDMSFFQNVESQKVLAVLLVYDEHCGHCQQFKPTWTSLTQKQNTDINGYQLQFFEIGNKNPSLRNEIMKKLNTQGYPSLYFLKGDRIQEYTNARDATTIMLSLQEF